MPIRHVPGAVPSATTHATGLPTNQSQLDVMAMTWGLVAGLDAGESSVVTFIPFVLFVGIVCFF